MATHIDYPQNIAEKPDEQFCLPPSAGPRDIALIAEIIESAYQKVLQDMRDLLAEFHKEYRPIPGHKGYMLSGFKCGKKDCPDCPHGIFWRKFTCKRVFDPETQDAPESGMTETQLNRSGYQETMPMPHSQAIPDPVPPADGEQPRRKTKIFWHKSKRLKSLPGSFFAKHERLSPENFQRFRYYHDRALRLNKQREALSHFREQIRYMSLSFRKNSLFAEFHR